MGKQTKVSKGMIKQIRRKIRAVIKENPVLKAEVDEQLAATPRATNEQAAREQRRRVYSSLRKKNKLLFEESRWIFDLYKRP